MFHAETYTSGAPHGAARAGTRGFKSTTFRTFHFFTFSRLRQRGPGEGAFVEEKKMITKFPPLIGSPDLLFVLLFAVLSFFSRGCFCLGQPPGPVWPMSRAA